MTLRNIWVQSHSPNPNPLKSQDVDPSCLAVYLMKSHVYPDLSLLSVQASLSITCPCSQGALMALEIRQAIDILSLSPVPHPHLSCIAREVEGS